MRIYDYNYVLYWAETRNSHKEAWNIYGLISKIAQNIKKEKTRLEMRNRIGIEGMIIQDTEQKQ